MIKATDVKALREATNVGMMECKKALTESNGDWEEAIKLLKEKGLALSAKRASKETNEGTIFIENQGNKAWMAKICCETDFVAKNDIFTDFAKIIGKSFVESGIEGLESETTKNLINDTVTKTGEKIEVTDPHMVESEGLIETYLHANHKVGVIVVLEGDESALKNDKVKELAKDLCLQITAMDPVAISMADVSEEIKNEQKEIFLKQMEEDPKPVEIKEKIISGKLNKYFAEKCLLEMEFVKESGSVKDHIAAVSKEIGGASIVVKKFVRSQIGG